MSGHDNYIIEFGRLTGVIQDRLRPLGYVERVQQLNEFDKILDEAREALGRGIGVDSMHSKSAADRAFVDSLVHSAGVIGSDVKHLGPFLDQGKRYVHALLKDGDELQKPIPRDSYTL